MTIGGSRDVLRGTAFGVGWLLAALLLSIAWYRVWMYKGFPGATGTLGQLLHADGERAYDVMAGEMFLICAAALAVVALAGRRLLRCGRHPRVTGGGLR
jgi:hypothetical protein